jgi:hypothetical protein
LRPQFSYTQFRVIFTDEDGYDKIIHAFGESLNTDYDRIFKKTGRFVKKCERYDHEIGEYFVVPDRWGKYRRRKKYEVRVRKNGKWYPMSNYYHLTGKYTDD